MDLNAIEAAEVLQERLAPWALPFTFSMHFGSRATDLQLIHGEEGQTESLRLIPERLTLTLSFDHRAGHRITLKVEEATNGRIVETVIATVDRWLSKDELHTLKNRDG